MDLFFLSEVEEKALPPVLQAVETFCKLLHEEKDFDAAASMLTTDAQISNYNHHHQAQRDSDSNNNQEDDDQNKKEFEFGTRTSTRKHSAINKTALLPRNSNKYSSSFSLKGSICTISTEGMHEDNRTTATCSSSEANSSSTTTTLDDGVHEMQTACRRLRFYPCEAGAHELQVVRVSKAGFLCFGGARAPFLEVFELTQEEGEEEQDDELEVCAASATTYKIKAAYLCRSLGGFQRPMLGAGRLVTSSRSTRKCLNDAWRLEIQQDASLVAAEMEERLRMCSLLN